MDGCCILARQRRIVLFGQPPEVLKALLKADAGTLEALVLPDVRERGGVLRNNVEFILYYFLFFEKGLERGRRLKLVGDPEQISHIFELLRLTLLGPTAAELEAWGTPRSLAVEWMNAGHYFSLKDESGAVIQASSFFEAVPFVDDEARLDDLVIRRTGPDRFDARAGGESVEVDMADSLRIEPPYVVPTDYVPSGLVRFGVEVLGGASGFTPEAPSTGLAVCFNGHYVLIDAIPYLDHHLAARGIAKNQISALYLTHLHDDHCNMFPLLRMPRKVDVITTREIYAMAMRKLAMGLGWTPEAVGEHFNLVEVRIGETLNYYGLEIDPHQTVHSIPTVGATFRIHDRGRSHEICVVGDIQTLSEIADMRARGLVLRETEANLHRLYTERFDLLVADGGMGPIHGDPADALRSKSERVVFVHVDRLPERFNATFSLAGSGKRYVIVDGDRDIYTTRAIEFLIDNFDRPLTSRWLSTLFADKSLKRYNTDDVIIKQGAETWGRVFLILTGYCDVIHHDGNQFVTLATLEAGDLMGEMARVTGAQVRNASVVARTPVMVFEFSEESFNTFVEAEGIKDRLLANWARRTVIGSLPQFHDLGHAVLDRLCGVAENVRLEVGERLDAQALGAYWCLVTSGEVLAPGEDAPRGLGFELGGFRPHAGPGPLQCETSAGASLVRFSREAAQGLLRDIPHLNYSLRKFRAAQGEADSAWRLGEQPLVQVLVEPRDARSA